MNHFERSFVIEKPINEVFSLISDIDKYHIFLPFCQSSTIISHHQHYMIAQLTFDFYGFKNSLTTKNTVKQNKSINMSFQNGPFKSFDAVWLFEEISSQSTQLDFKMDYKLNNPLLEFAFKKNLNSASDIIVNAFKEKL